MHLKILEDYICDLMEISIEKPHARFRIDTVCGELMDVLIEQERLIPDFVMNGDTNQVVIDQNQYEVVRFSQIDEQTGREDMKKLAWLMATAFISGICFLIGFFVAP